MQLPEICIKRPVFATVLSLIILLVGLSRTRRLPVREYPRIDEPVVSVVTDYRGASAEVVESQVTKPLEDSLAGIEGVEVMTSQSRSETSAHQRPLHAEARSRTRPPPTSATRSRAPAASCPTRSTSRSSPRSKPMPIRSSTSRCEAGSLTTLEASDYVKRYVQPRLSVLPGAADVRIFGERQVSMRINLDRTRLAGYKLTVQDVEDAHPPAERRDPGGPHRIAGARVHRRRRDRRPHSRAVQQHHRRQRRRLSGAHPRRRQRRDRPGRGAGHLALQRQAVAQHRRDQAGGGQSARAVEGGARRSRSR